MPVPTRSTSEQALDQWNIQMRASPAYQNFMRSQGLPTDGRVQLSRAQQSALERELARSGMPIPSGMHIDQGGNLNQRNNLLRNVGIGAGLAGAALTGAGLAGIGPLAGGGGAAAGGAGAAGAAGAGAGAGAAGAGTGGILATTGWAAPMAGYAAPAVASGVGAGTAAGIGAAGAGAAGAGAAGGGGILSTLGRYAGLGGDIGSVLAGAGAGQAQERGAENRAIGDTNRARASMYGTQQGSILSALNSTEAGRLNRANLDLDRRRFALDAPTTRAQQSVRGSAMANAQDVNISGLPSRIRVPTITGGLRPSMLGPESRQLGQALMSHALESQMRGDQFEDIPETDFQGGLIPPPTMDPYQGAGAGESIASGAGTVGGILSLLSRFVQQRQVQGRT